MSRSICLEPCPPGPPLSITIPMMGSSLGGGGNLTMDTGCANCEIVGNFSLQLGILLSGLGLPLCLLGCAAAIIEFVKAVPDSLGPPPDPSKLIDAVENVGPACACVIAMALPPPIGAICDFLKLVRDIVQLFYEILSCLVGLLQSILSINISASLMLGDTDQGIILAGQCLSRQAQWLSDLLGGKLGGFLSLIKLMKSLFTLLSAVVPPPFDAKITDLENGFAVFTGGIHVGLPPGDFLTSVQDLLLIIQDVYIALVDICMICPQ